MFDVCWLLYESVGSKDLTSTRCFVLREAWGNRSYRTFEGVVFFAGRLCVEVYHRCKGCNRLFTSNKFLGMKLHVGTNGSYDMIELIGLSKHNSNLEVSGEKYRETNPPGLLGRTVHAVHDTIKYCIMCWFIKLRKATSCHRIIPKCCDRFELNIP